MPKLNYAIEARSHHGSAHNAILEEGFPSAMVALDFLDSEVGVEARVVRIRRATGERLPQTKWLKPFIG